MMKPPRLPAPHAAPGILKQLKKLSIDPFENSEDELIPDGEGSGEAAGNPEAGDREGKGKEGIGKPLDKMSMKELLAFVADKGIAVSGAKEEVNATLKAVVEREARRLWR
jgi:hypothetical protein